MTLIAAVAGVWVAVGVFVLALCKAAARGDRMARNGWRNR